MLNLHRSFAVLALASFTAAGTALAADDEIGLDMQPGLWSTRTYHTIEITGQPAAPGRSRTSQQCVTGESIDPSELFGAEQGCRVDDRKFADGVLTFRMTCPAASGEMSGTARYEATGTEGKGHLEMVFRAEELEGKVIIDMKTKRVGDC